MEKIESHLQITDGKFSVQPMHDYAYTCFMLRKICERYIVLVGNCCMHDGQLQKREQEQVDISAVLTELEIFMALSIILSWDFNICYAKF